MALGALAAAAGGQLLGGALGKLLGGGPDYKLTTTSRDITTQQLNPEQLQQILNDLTQAESSGRGDVSGNVERALGLIMGDPNVGARNELINQQAQLELRDQQDRFFEKHAAPFRELLAGDLQNILKSSEDYVKSIRPEDRGSEHDYTNSHLGLQRGVKNFMEKLPDIPLHELFSFENGKFDLQGPYKDYVQGVARGTRTGPKQLYDAFKNTSENRDFQRELETIKADSPQLRQRAEERAQLLAPDIFQTQGAQQIDPFLQANQRLNLGALNQLAAFSGLPGSDGQVAMSPEDIQARLEQTPGYQFRAQQGQQAVERAGSARGLLESGAILKGLTEFGQGLASQEFGAEQDRLAKLAGLTQNPALAGTSQAQQNRLAGAELISGQGGALANLATGQAAQRSSALLQGGQLQKTTSHQQLIDRNKLR